MLKKFLIGTAVTAMLAGSTIAHAAGDSPGDFEPGDRAVFVNEDESMKSADEIKSGFMALPVERQDAIRAQCVEIRKVAKDGTQQQKTNNNDGDTNAVPGVYDQYTACDMVDTM